MSILDQGRRELDERQASAEQRAHHDRQQNLDSTSSWFYRDFYRHLFRYDQGRRRHVAEGLPPVHEWTPASDDSRADSTFLCEGLRYRCRWTFHGTGGDRAYWDDGWWPDWFLLVPKRRWLIFPIDAEAKVHGPESVAEAAAEHGLVRA